MHAIEQRTEAAEHTASSPHGPSQLRTETVDAVLRSPGVPLDNAVQPSMEAAFGTGFSDVRLHSDMAAARSAADLGAQAYTVGQHVVLGRGAGQHTLVHELAHVVQQRGAAAAPGPLTLSRPGDSSERAADAAAHRVVNGGRAAGGLAGTSRRQVARQPDHSAQHVEVQKSRGGVPSVRRGHKPSLQEESDASTALMIAAGIVQGKGRELVATPARYAVALRELYVAKQGTVYSDAHDYVGKKYTGTDRLKALDQALAGLRPAIILMQRDTGQAEWLDGEFTPYLGSIRESALLQQAEDRVQGSVTIDKKTVEIPDDEHPREQAELLKSFLPKLIDTISQINEQAIRLGHDQIHHAALEMFEGEGHHAKGFGKWAGNLVELQSVLIFAQGVLTLTDEEFKDDLNHFHGVFGGIATYTELVKVCVELTGGAVALSASYAAVIAKMIGNEGAMLAAQGVARSVGLVLGNVIPGIEIVWGVMVLFDPHASSEKKEHAALAVASGTAWYIGGGLATLGVALTYLELKWLASEYWAAVLGWDGTYLRGTFKYMQRYAETIIAHGDAMHRAHDLMVAEKDPGKAAALQKDEHVEGARLQHSLDEFLETCVSGGWQEPWRPGGYGTLRGKFARLMHFRSASTTAETVEAAKETLEAIVWCFNHAGDIVLAEAKRMNIEQLEAQVKRNEQDKKQEEDEAARELDQAVGSRGRPAP